MYENKKLCTKPNDVVVLLLVLDVYSHNMLIHMYYGIVRVYVVVRMFVDGAIRFTGDFVCDTSICSAVLAVIFDSPHAVRNPC